METLSVRLRNALLRFHKSDSGNIAVLFAIACIPLISFVGAAIDYTRASASRSAMQSALDSATLMASKDISSGIITSSQVTAKAQSYFTALYNNKDAQSISIVATYTAASGGSGQTLKLDGSGTVPTEFLKVVGYPTLKINNSSMVTWGNKKLRVALALDNTGSMNDYNKIGALKTATTNMVSKLSALSQSNGDVYISVIPFGETVNISSANVNSNLIRWDLWDSKNYPDANFPWQTYCSGGYFMTMATCIGHGYNWGHTPDLTMKNQWSGCVTDRDPSYDTDNSTPTSKSTYFIADQDQFCAVAPILPLSYNWSAINNLVSSMIAQGATNQTIGLQWAWLSLLQAAPMNAPVESSNETYDHVIILFTDGLNTADRWYGDGFNQSSQVDGRMNLLCNNIKASGVQIYTVQIDTDGAGQSAVLPSCASGSSNFFMLTQPSQIDSAFAQITTAISKLRVAQ